MPAEIRTSPFPICSLLTVVSRAAASTKPDTRTTDYCLPVGTHSTQEEKSIEAIGLLVTLEALAGKEADAEAFLKAECEVLRSVRDGR